MDGCERPCSINRLRPSVSGYDNTSSVATVATTTATSSDWKRSWTLARSAAPRPAWYAAAFTPARTSPSAMRSVSLREMQ